MPAKKPTTTSEWCLVCGRPFRAGDTIHQDVPVHQTCMKYLARTTAFRPLGSTGQPRPPSARPQP